MISMTSRSSSVRKLGKRHISVFRYFTATRGIHSTSASFQTSWLAESGAHDLVVATLSTMAARGLRHTAVSMNELNSHCSDAVTTMAMDSSGHPFPASRSSFILRLIVLSAELHELYPYSSSLPFPVQCSLPLSFLYYCSHISLRIQRFPAFFISLHFVLCKP